MTRPHCSGAILAGGGAIRFGGRAKGLERVAGVRIIDRVADALRGAADSLVVASAGADAAGWIPGVESIPDARPHRGSLVGLHAALAHAERAHPGGGVLAVAWDMPFVPAALLRALRETGEREGAAVVPSTSDGPEPFCAYYPSSALAALERQLDAGEMRAAAFVAALPRVVRLDGEALARFGDPATLFFNVNSPDDLARAERIAAKS